MGAHANASTSGQALLRSIPTTGWDAGAVSTKAIISGDGYVEVTSSMQQHAMFGLSSGNTDASYPDIDFAIYMAWNEVQIYERVNCEARSVR